VEERRTRYRAELCGLLISGKKDDCSQCDWGKIRSQKYKQILGEFTPIKMLEASLSDIITKMDCVPDDDTQKRACMPFYIRNGFHEALPYRETLAGISDAMKKESNFSIEFVRKLGTTEH
jgi:hypothetical protein